MPIALLENIRKAIIMAKRKQTGIKRIVRLLTGAIVAFFVATFLSGCADEQFNPLGTQKVNGEAPKEESYCIQMDCCGYYNGEYLPVTKKITQLYPMRFTGNWTLIPEGIKKDWYMATTAEKGARVDLCATMTRCVFDFWDWEFYDDPGVIQVLLDDQVLGTYDLKRKSDKGFKILDYVVATQKNTVATASIVLLSGRMVLSGCQVNVFNKHWPY